MAYKLKIIRQTKGLSQSELALKSNVSRSIISGIESGRIGTTTTGTLKKLADALSVKISDFFA